MLVEFYFNNQLIPITNIEEIRIRESINSPIIEGEILIFDFNLIDYKTIKDQKQIPINFIVYDQIEDENKELIFTVTELEGGTTQTQNKIAIGFTNRNSIDLVSKFTTAYFNDIKYSKMLIQTLSSVGFKSKALESGNKETRYFPYSSGLEKIRYIQERIVDKNNRAGYLIFPDLFTNEQNIINLNHIIEGNFGTYEYPLFKNYENVAYIGHIDEILTIKNYDVMKFIEVSSANRYTFNMNSGIVENSEQDITLIKNLPLLLNKEYLKTEYNKREFTVFSNKNGLNNFNSNEFYKFIQNQIVINCVANGDWNRKVGYLIAMIAYKDDTSGSVLDEKLSGKFIIKDVEHVFNQHNYMQNMNLIKI